jgi:hypothetical protein
MVVSMSAKPLTVKEFEASVAEMWGSAVESTYKDLIEKAVLEEREACAQLCEDSVEYAGSELARQIRARK